jgi:hypothetical protein
MYNPTSTAPAFNSEPAKMTWLLWITCCTFLSLWITACHQPTNKTKESDLALPVKVEPMLISQLGPEHFGNAIYRRGIEGPGIAASGSRILEWPVQASALTTEVVPPGPDNYQNGACAMDVNGDNIDEMIVGRTTQLGTDLLWFEEIPGQKVWKEHLIAVIKGGKGEEGLHDIMPFEMKVLNKTLMGVTTIVNRRSLYWYQIPDDVTQLWTQHMIADLSKHGSECAQSGLVLGDVAGNGRQDLVCGNFWAECPADPTRDSWKIHRYSNWDCRTTPTYPDMQTWVFETRFGGMNQLELGDMNNDGKLDIVASDAEIPEARVGIFYQNMTNTDGLWNETIIDTAVYCPHSLVVADVNADSRPDIIVCEMTAGGWWFPRNPDPKLYLYLNKGNLKFQKYILHSGWGTHMMRMIPQQQKKKVFVFAADEIQSWYKDMTTNLVGWTISPIK